MIRSSDRRLLFILDLLPQEILYTIFDFLWAHDIVYSFHTISNYIDSILLTYHNYHINFKSILKRQFDLVCRFIQPNQIKSLVLSDSNETPSQSKFFLSLFPIEQFINLRAITLSAIENDSRSLFANIHQLKCLNYFETDTLSHLWMIETMPRIKQIIVNKLVDNDYNHESLLYSMSFSHLRNLTLPHCSYVQLRQILCFAPKLTSLNISLMISDCTGIDYFAEQHQETPLMITHLNMSIHTVIELYFFFFVARTISRLLFERFLSRMPHLQQLELTVSSGGSSNLLEGNQWEVFINKYLLCLSIFQFKFKIIHIDRNNYNEKNILTQFNTSFWLHRNPQWYVAYNIDDLILYTVPYFAPRTIKHSLLSTLPHSTTLPVEKYFIYYDQIDELELDSNYKSSYRYRNVQRLVLSMTTIDENIIDLSKVEYLCVKSSTWSLKKLFQIIKTSMTRLYNLKIDFSFSLIQLSDIYSLEQIRILDLPQFSCSFKDDNMDLSSFFPCVERLTIGVSNLYLMSHVIDQFLYLSTGSFRIINDHSDISHILTEPDMIYKWLIEKTNRLAKDRSFTYRLDSQSGIWIHLWMSSEPTRMEKVFNTTLRAEQQLMGPKETNAQCGCSRYCLLQ